MTTAAIPDVMVATDTKGAQPQSLREEHDRGGRRGRSPRDRGRQLRVERQEGDPSQTLRALRSRVAPPATHSGSRSPLKRPPARPPTLLSGHLP